ncbi:MAG: dephospho-CoA kinase [Bacteroidales bacterium]
MIKIGVTGGLGSGKSVVSNLLQINGIPVYNSDTEAKRLMNTSNTIRRKIVDLLGDSSYSDSQLNRSYVAQRVFGDTDMLRQLNAIVHPEVRKDFLQWSSIQNRDIVAIESAILFESELSPLLDKIVVVSAPIELRIARVLARDGLSEEQIRLRIEAQMDDETRECLADFVVVNDRSRAIIPQINQILKELRNS